MVYYIVFVITMVICHVKFIDDFQNIITDYMKCSSFSVGISDLKSNESTKKKLVKK